MILRVNPNRMELLRLRRRLVLAKRGHKLLQDKLEDMIRRFLVLHKDADRVKTDFQRLHACMVRDFLYCRLVSAKEDFEAALNQINTDIALQISLKRIMNVKVPVFTIEKLTIEKHYDFVKTSAQLDMAVAAAKEYITALLRLAEILKTLEILANEIERTRRRVNALKYILIPSLNDTIRYISQKLSEFELSNLVKLMRVKDIVRSR